MSNIRNEEINRLTRESLAMSATRLLRNMPFQKISVKKLCDTAGVSRNAFYRNYADLGEVLKNYIEIQWDQYCLDHDLKMLPFGQETPDLAYHIVSFFFQEKELMLLLKKNQLLSILEDFLLKLYLPEQTEGVVHFFHYIIAFISYGLIRAMIENDFSQTPDEILLLFKETEKNIEKKTAETADTGPSSMNINEDK